VQKSHECCRIECAALQDGAKQIRPGCVKVWHLGSGTPRERETAAHNPTEPVWTVVPSGARRARNHTRRKIAWTKSASGQPTSGGAASGSNVEAGSSQGWSPSDSAAQPANAEGKTKPHERLNRVGLTRVSRYGKGSTRRFNPSGPTGMKGADDESGKAQKRGSRKNRISRTLERQRMNTRARRDADNSRQSRPAADDEKID